MAETPSDDDRLFSEALDLMIRLQNDPGNPVARDMVRAWRARGPEHETAWAEVAEIHGMAGKVLGDQRKAASPSDGLTRRKAMFGGVAAVAVLGTAAYYGPDALLRLRADQVTATAELRNVTLADNSVVTLGPRSAIRSTMNADLREVELLAGMAFFDVARDAARPFRARMGGLSVSSAGASFDLGMDAQVQTVSVSRGVIDVTGPEASLLGGMSLVAGQLLTRDEETRRVERLARDISQIAAWRDGTIVAEHERISAVAAKIGRWYDGRIVIADMSLGAQRISGVFDLKDPMLALEAVMHPLGAKVRKLSPWLTVVTTI